MWDTWLGLLALGDRHDELERLLALLAEELVSRHAPSSVPGSAVTSRMTAQWRYGCLKISATTITRGDVPLLSSQCVVSFARPGSPLQMAAGSHSTATSPDSPPESTWILHRTMSPVWNCHASSSGSWFSERCGTPARSCSALRARHDLPLARGWRGERLLSGSRPSRAPSRPSRSARSWSCAGSCPRQSPSRTRSRSSRACRWGDRGHRGPYASP